MLKLPLSLLVLLGTCAAQNAHPLTELQGTSRVLIVFAPNSNSANFQRQLQLIERHAYELTERNTVVVPVSLASAGTDDHFSGENLPLATSEEQTVARKRFHVQPSDFLVVLLSQDGTEQIRSTNPLDIHQLTAKLDSLPRL
jgi:peroxiredoxin